VLFVPPPDRTARAAILQILLAGRPTARDIDAAALAAHTPFLLTRARRICRNDADARDLVQDTCLHAIEALKRTGIPPDNVRAWLIVIMRNQWLSSMRQQRVRVNAHAELATRPAVDDATVESRIVPDQLVRAWNRLPAHSQHIARQHLIDGCSQEELSRRLGMTAGGVAASIHRTRDALRRAMRELTSAFELETI